MGLKRKIFLFPFFQFLGMIFSLLLCCAIREAAEGGSKY